MMGKSSELTLRNDENNNPAAQDIYVSINQLSSRNTARSAAFSRAEQDKKQKTNKAKNTNQNTKKKEKSKEQKNKIKIKQN